MELGVPRDPAQWLALVLAAGVLASGTVLVRRRRRAWLFVALAAAGAAALSALYVAVYLRGGPRIIDATSYWLEAREMARGHFAWPLHEPATATLGRFLIRSESPDGPRAAVIFPPGYPALLSLGFRVGAPMVLGPLLAAGVCAVTYLLARQVERDLGLDGTDPGRVSIASLAALLSVVCAALRYHTADTMSHGLAALCFTGSLVAALHALETATDRWVSAGVPALLAGLAAGWLVATRPASGVALAVVLALAFATERRPVAVRLRLAAALAVAATPGIALLLYHQRAATGASGVFSQALYYAVSDGPPGCFRYGFGKGIGCVLEHGDFVRARLAEGYGLVAAAGTTLRRLKMHLVDVGNLEPLALLVPAGAWIGWCSRRVRLLSAALVLQIAVYAPFYFDGNYPGGGARLLADVLPLEHALCAAAVVLFSARWRLGERAAAWALSMALAGFAVRAGFDHAMLRDRDGGRPMFEPAELARAGIEEGLVFVDTDHGYNLGAVPSAEHPRLSVARRHGDALDVLAWEAEGRPPAYRYDYTWAPGEPAHVEVRPFAVDDPERRLGIEGESMWPALRQDGAWVLPEHAAGSCASGGRWLAVHGVEAGSVELSLPAALAGKGVAPRFAATDVAATVELVLDGRPATRWTVAGRGGPVACPSLQLFEIPSDVRRIELRISRGPAGPAGVLALDRLEIRGL